MAAAIVLLGVPEDSAAAVTRALQDSSRTVVAMHSWIADVAPRDVGLVVIGVSDILGAVVSLRRSTAAPLLALCRDVSSDAAVALDAGADACLDRRSSPAHVVAQVRALLRREVAVTTREPAAVTIGAITLDSAARRAAAAGTEMKLSPREFDLLGFLTLRRGRAVRREELLAAVWGPRYMGATNTVDVHIAWLRQKLPEDCGVRITTLRGVGYRLDELVQV